MHAYVMHTITKNELQTLQNIFSNFFRIVSFWFSLAFFRMFVVFAKRSIISGCIYCVLWHTFYRFFPKMCVCFFLFQLRLGLSQSKMYLTWPQKYRSQIKFIITNYHNWHIKYFCRVLRKQISVTQMQK